MVKCPICDNILKNHTPEGWQCECGELIPFGFEKDAEENCETCPVMYCPKRITPIAFRYKNV
ncbi:MAG: hypothetical protein HY756_06045 [Nitrospirae bacterium]|nr:hypothetical protein [Nitrospirota bacterium]